MHQAGTYGKSEEYEVEQLLMFLQGDPVKKIGIWDKNLRHELEKSQSQLTYFPKHTVRGNCMNVSAIKDLVIHYKWYFEKYLLKIGD